MKPSYDYIIVGHGLAGAVLAHELLSIGKRVLVFDDPQKNTSSSVAAGLFNPVTGRQMVKTWMADLLFPYLIQLYTKLEQRLATKFFHPIGIYRPFAELADQNDWLAKGTDPIYQSILKSIETEKHTDFSLNDFNGGLHLNMSGFVNIPVFLKASRVFLTKKNSYREEHFEESLLHHISQGVTYGNIAAHALIFCNGLGGSKSTYFDWLPFRPVKGEILSLRLDKGINRIYNRGVFLVPNGRSSARLGATYKNDFEDLNTTVQAKEELCRKFEQLCSENYQVIDAVAGLRPATKDRRPIIGKHFEYQHIYMFNGFGSKGVSLVPFFSGHFIEYLEGKTSLNREIDIRRYASLYQGR